MHIQIHIYIYIYIYTYMYKCLDAVAKTMFLKGSLGGELVCSFVALLHERFRGCLKRHATIPLYIYIYIYIYIHIYIYMQKEREREREMCIKNMYVYIYIYIYCTCISRPTARSLKGEPVAALNLPKAKKRRGPHYPRRNR